MRRALCSLSALLILALSLLIAGNAAPQRPRRRLQRGDRAPLRLPRGGGGPHALPQRLAGQPALLGRDYSVGSGGFDTRFSYGEAIDCRDDSSGRSVYGVEFGSGTFFSGSLSDNDAIDAIFSGLAERALAAGAGRYEDYSETIYLADYFDYYPVDAPCHTPRASGRASRSFSASRSPRGQHRRLRLRRHAGRRRLQPRHELERQHGVPRAAERGDRHGRLPGLRQLQSPGGLRLLAHSRRLRHLPPAPRPGHRPPGLRRSGVRLSRWTRRSCTPCTSTPPTTASCCSPPSSPSPGT